MSPPTESRDTYRALQRVSVMVVIGITVGLILGFTTGPVYGIAAGWVGASVYYIGSIWLVTGRLDADRTREYATREDPGAVVSDTLVLIASIASLAAVGMMLVRAKSLEGWEASGVASLAVAVVITSWLLIQTVYTMRYARIYYTEPIGGIDFNNPCEQPRYIDFAYLAFDLGQTFQVSDTDVSTTELRSMMLWHTLLSYAFNTVILAAIINVVVGLGG